MARKIEKCILGMMVFVVSLVHAGNFKIQHWTTQKGSQVFFVKLIGLPMLDLRVAFAAGSVYDGKNWGVASLTNNMIGQSTATLSSNQIADAFDQVGAQFDNSMSRDMAVLSLRTLTDKKYLMPALKTFDDVMSHAVFNEKPFSRVMSQSIAAIKVSMQQPDTVANKKFLQVLYGDEAYGHPVIGTLASLPKITPASVKDFYNEFYVAKNADIILVGDITKNEATTIANTLSNDLPIGKPAPKMAMMTQQTQGKAVHVQFPSEQTAIIYGQLAMSRDNPNYFPLVVGNYILGGLPMTSLLFDNVRIKRGLAYGVSSQFDPLRYKGPFVIQLKTRANKTADSVKVVEDTLTDFIKNGPSEDQLKAAKSFINGSFPLSSATNGSIANTVTNIAFYDRPLDFMDTYLEKINAVTANDVKNAFQQTLHINDMLLVTVGPNQK